MSLQVEANSLAMKSESLQDYDNTLRFSDKKDKSENLNLDEITEKPITKKDLEDNIIKRIEHIEGTCRFSDEQDYTKNEFLNLEIVKVESFMKDEEEGSISQDDNEFIDGTWCYPDNEDNRNDPLNVDLNKDETIIKRQTGSNNFQEENELTGSNNFTNDESKQFKCKFCPQVYTSGLDLSDHLEIHRKRKLHKSSHRTVSVVQEILTLKQSGGLTDEERLEMKGRGPPKPELNLKQTTKDRGKCINRYFNESMYSLCEWICGCDVKNAFFCYPCLLFSEDILWTRNGVTDLKHLKEKVKKHTASVVHMNSSMNYASLGRADIRLQLDSAYRKSIQDFNEGVSKNRYILNKIIDCIKFCGSFELALRDQDETDSSENLGVFHGLIDFVSELDAIFKNHIENSTVLRGISKAIQNDILESMLTVVHTQIATEIAQANFIAMQVDEMIDCSNKMQMIFIFRYVLNGIIHERFWKFVNPPGTTAQHLADVILNELRQLNFYETPNKLIAQTYDGAAVMSGKLGGVQAKIKQYYPTADFIHCYAHQLNLVLQKAASQYKEIKVFFANLHAYSSFFGLSPKRTEVLDNFVKVRLSTTGPSTQDFSSRCVETVHNYRIDILNCLGKIIDDEEDSNTLNQAGILQWCLKDENFLYWLNFFHLIMPHVDILSNQLQKRDVDVLSIKQYLNAFRSNIQKIRDTVTGNEVSDSSPSASQRYKRKETSDSKRTIAIEVCDIILSEIKHRFAFCDHLMISQLFETDQFETYNKKFPQEILDLVKRNYSSVNHSKLKTELEVIYGRNDFRNSAGALAVLQLFINMNLTETFSECVTLLNILCTLPMTTVESERCFSTLKRIKTFLYNTMGQPKLSALAMLSIEKSLVKTITNFNDKVIDHFASQKERLIDLKYKQA